MKILTVNNIEPDEDLYLCRSGNPNKDENGIDEELDDAERDNHPLLYLRGGLWIFDASL